MSAPSVLFADPADSAALPQHAPAFFTDLNLDAVVAAVTAGKDEYDLRPFFYAPLTSVEAVLYRQAVMRDLEEPAILRTVKSFAQGMQATRIAIARTAKRYHPQQRNDILIRGLLVEVRPHDGSPDYGAQVAALLDRFDREGAKDYAFDFAKGEDVNPVEGNILKLVAQTHPHAFEPLADFCKASSEFLDEAIVRFDREVQFYVAYLDHKSALQKEGIRFCYPQVSADDKSVDIRGAVDLALAGKLAKEHKMPVPNDARLGGMERVIVVTGPNQGGKTTFSRCFAQLHYLAALGCPVPAARARLYLPDRIFTHFERAERMTNPTGKLHDDLERIHDILEHATPRSLVVINEIFASTTLSDAIALSRRIAGRIAALDLLCVWVTFIDEIAILDGKTVSMVSVVDPDEPERRTFRIERRPPDGLAYALSLARKYRLTREQILARVRP
jgi:hypothetical protein